jgi:hypothetical protein
MVHKKGKGISMKKVVMMVMMALVATSYGIVNVNWMASGGFYFTADPNTGILGADDSGLSTIAQLIYSPDQVRDDLWAGAVNDVVIENYTITADGSSFAGYALFPTAQNYQAAFGAGWVYAMIYQDDTPVSGESYYYTPMLALENIEGETSPQFIQMNQDLNFGDAIDGNLLDPTTNDAANFGTWAIPEPTTMLLFGIGGMGAWLLRRRQQA